MHSNYYLSVLSANNRNTEKETLLHDKMERSSGDVNAKMTLLSLSKDSPNKEESPDYKTFQRSSEEENVALKERRNLTLPTENLVCDDNSLLKSPDQKSPRTSPKRSPKHSPRCAKKQKASRKNLGLQLNIQAANLQNTKYFGHILSPQTPLTAGTPKRK